jgi:predicted phage terminase large subunit-like protein
MISASDCLALGVAAATLPQTAWERIRRQVEAEQSLYEFLRQAWPVVEPGKPFVPGWHIEALCEHLEAVTRGQIRNLLVMVPPGSTKTTTVCVAWPAWEWIGRPETRWLYSSYSLPRAHDAARLRSLLVRSPWYRSNWSSRFRLTTTADTELHNDKVGWCKCVSVQSGTTGEHGDRLVIDDPHNVKDVESDAMRHETVRWHDQAWFNRVNDPMRSSRVNVAQRTHHEDLMGHLEARGDYVILRIPEEFEADRRCFTSVGWADPRRDDGELMRPERFGPEQVAEAKRTLGSLGYAAQHQQRPSPKGGALFKRAWWKNRARFELQSGDAIIRQGKPGVLSLDRCPVFAVVDGGASSKETSDPTVIAVFAVDTQTGDLFVLHVARARLEVEEVIPVLDDLCSAWRPDWVGIEANGFQVWFVKEARDRARFPAVPTVRELLPEGKGKAARAAPAIIRAEQGEIFLPYPDDPQNPWVSQFEEELYGFTGKEGGRDDGVDCLAYACLSLDRFGYGAGCDELPPPDYSRRPGPWN